MKLIISIILSLIVAHSYGMFNERRTALNNDPVILFVVKNNVSPTISVHTYKYIKIINIESTSDVDEQVELSKNIQFIIDTFLSVQGVSRCTYDRATQTFTILAIPTTTLFHVEEIINNNKTLRDE